MLTTFALAAVALTPLRVSPLLKPTIVLVHGAFADGSAWRKVVPLLQKQGYTVAAAQNPMTSYADDVATTRRLVEETKGPVVLVGHSYGGAVISGVGTGMERVKALVYIAAFGPAEGESLGEMLQKYPTPLGSTLVPDGGGFVTIDRAKYHDVFAADLPLAETNALAVAQGPIKGDIFGTPMPAPAWKTIPSWYMVAKSDHAISPELERYYAGRMNAKTTEIESSHVPFLSHPEAVAKIIVAAASAVADHAVESGS